MRRGMIGLVLLACMPTAHAQTLEDAIVGQYRARGFFSPAPDKPRERLSCRLTGAQTAPLQYALQGKCASANLAGDMQILVDIVAPEQKYEVGVRFAGDNLLGFDSEYTYVGMADGQSVVFEARVQIEGVAHQSKFRIGWSDEGVNRIVETVRARNGGREFVLVDLDVQGQ